MGRRGLLYDRGDLELSQPEVDIEGLLPLNPLLELDEAFLGLELLLSHLRAAVVGDDLFDLLHLVVVEALMDVEDALAALVGEELSAAGVGRDHALLDDFVSGPPGLDDDLLECAVLVEDEVIVRAVLE